MVVNQKTTQGGRRTIVADSGAFHHSADGQDALLTLYSGEVQEVNTRKQQQFQRMFFDKHTIRLAGVGRALAQWIFRPR